MATHPGQAEIRFVRTGENNPTVAANRNIVGRGGDAA
jgi:hypothetical protein